MVRIDLTPQSTSQTAGDNHLATANTCNWKECNYICTGVQLMIVGNCELRNAARQKKIQPNQFMLQPDPVRPPWAPVLAIRVTASAWVVHVIEVPGEFTRGKAAQIKGLLHSVTANFPPTH